MATRGKKEKEYPPMPANWMYKRGDVYMMDLNPYSGSEQGGIRPAIVVQNDDGNFYSNVLLVVPLTTQIKKRNMPTHFILHNRFLSAPSIPEMAKLLGIPRKNVYGILDCKKYRDCFVIERVADRPRITKKSFKAWLKSQSTYQLQKSKKETHEEPPLKLQCPKNGKYYSFQEIQAFYGISRPTLDSWVLKEGIPTMKLGRVKRIQKEAFDEVLKSKRKVEEDV